MHIKNTQKHTFSDKKHQKNTNFLTKNYPKNANFLLKNAFFRAQTAEKVGKFLRIHCRRSDNELKILCFYK
jgi:hypothetical protein